MTYNAYITRIRNVRKHPDADRLLLGECFGNQVVVGLDTKEDELGIYFPTGGRLSIEFMESNNLIGKIDENGNRSGGFFDEKGHVRTQKFRKEKSDGFYCPLTYLTYTNVDFTTLTNGTQFTEISGHKICEKYITTKTKEYAGQKKKAQPKVKFPCFHRHIDTEQLVYNKNRIRQGNVLVITEKLHGTSGRSAYTLSVSQSWISSFINGLFKREIISPKKEWKYVAGSRRVVIKNFERIDGWYGADEVIRAHAHMYFENKLHKGETVYYEIVGYTPSGSIMPAVNNLKLKDKAFVKQYGEETVFNYGYPEGLCGVYVYRITMTNEDGVEIDYTTEHIIKRCKELEVSFIPVLSTMIVDNPDDAIAFVERCANGASTLTPKHIREGVVVRIDGSKWEAYKHKSFEFKVLEGIIKDTGVVDIEEAS